VNVIARARFAKAAKYPLVSVDNAHRHTGRAAAVIDKVRVAIGNI